MHLQNHSARKTSAQFALSAADQKRPQRLATAAESTPQHMLKFVPRDGFAYREKFVRRASAGLVSAWRDEIISDGEAALLRPVVSSPQAGNHLAGQVTT